MASTTTQRKALSAVGSEPWPSAPTGLTVAPRRSGWTGREMNFMAPSVRRVSWVAVLVVVAVAAQLPFSGTGRDRDPDSQIAGSTAITGACRLNPGHFLASIDTMKESMDTDAYPLTSAQIADDVNLAATLSTNYVTVDTHWDYPAYMRRWVDAVRNARKHVWFRIHPNAWGGTNGVRAT